MVSATARYLEGRDSPLLGHPHAGWLRPALVGVNHLPDGARRWIYRNGSGREAQDPEAVATLSAEDLADQVVRRYPPGPYPAIAVGSTPGSVVHLCAALRAPLLPQTLLVPLARDEDAGFSLDDPGQDIRAAGQVARAMLAANPELILHQMFDPNGDRLTLARFSYLRVKRAVLGPTYRQFITRNLAPGGTILVIDCAHQWPVTTVGERHLFQFGGVGGVSPEELSQGSPRIAAFLEAQGSDRRAWDPPPPDRQAPEAEWGLEPALAEDVEAFGAHHGYRVLRARFDRADDMSPLVADLYRWWYGRQGRPTDRLFVESFVLLDPWWVLRAGAVPLWMTFNTDAGAGSVERYLDSSPPYARIEVTLVSNGIDAVGLASIDRWRKVLARATSEGRFAGVDPARFPRDLAVFARFRDTLRAGPAWPMPAPLALDELDAFLSERGDRYAVSVTRS